MEISHQQGKRFRLVAVKFIGRSLAIGYCPTLSVDYLKSGKERMRKITHLRFWDDRKGADSGIGNQYSKYVFYVVLMLCFATLVHKYTS